MIGVTFEQMLLIYMALIFLIPGVSLVLQVLGSNYNKIWRMSEDRLARCRDCNVTFLLTRQHSVTRCPWCNSLRVNYPK